MSKTVGPLCQGYDIQNSDPTRFFVFLHVSFARPGSTMLQNWLKRKSLPTEEEPVAKRQKTSEDTKVQTPPTTLIRSLTYALRL